MFIGRSLLCLLGAAWLCAAPPTHAAMQLSRTRLIVTEDAPKAVIEAQNKDTLPLLLQAWISTQEEGDAQQTPENLPLIVDPPVARLEAGQSRALQVWLTQADAALAADRESLFWLNVLEVPVADDAIEPDRARIYLAVQSRLKLFCRPRTLAALEAGKLDERMRLRFAVAREAQQHWLNIHNPAPIHQTLARVVLTAADAAAPLELPEVPMLAPFATARLALPAVFDPNRAPWHLQFAVIDDDGNVVEAKQAL